jgi:UDP-N-acetylmuramate: L-alanyl-gamma-D-glutamyl-meso-diaminopimelate ligase
MKSISDYADSALRTFERPPVPPPDAIDDVYLIGICGTGMGALAGLFQQAGYDVRGADEAAYPPMSTHLAAQGIPVLEGYDPAHLDPPPDLTVVGNACRPAHPEATVAREEGLVQQSFPEALGHFFLAPDRRSIVLAGTHGKTTTTGLLVHTLHTAGVNAGFLVGGVMQNTGRSYALGTDAPFVVEGDEYDSAYFDKRPKFMHYRPDTALVSSVEFDHADIYASADEYRRAFERFVGMLDANDGLLALCADAPSVRGLAEATSSRVQTYGLCADADVGATRVRTTPEGQAFILTVDGVKRGPMHLPLHGEHNLQNALGVALLARSEGCSPQQIADGFATFNGMKRRQEVRGEPGGVRVLDDFAHHPTAVDATIRAVASAHPDRRLVAVFEPRSNSSRRKIFEDPYGRAFDAADRVFLKAPPVRHNDDLATMLDPAAVVAAIRERGVPAHAFAEVNTLLAALIDALTAGDIALLMSNGSFDGLHEKLLDALTDRASGSP